MALHTDAADASDEGGGSSVTISTSNPQPIGTAAPGSTGEVSDAGHVHALAAKVLVAEAAADLANEVNLGALASGLLKHAVAAGVSTPARAVPAVDYVAPAASADKTISSNTITPDAGSLLVKVTGGGTLSYITTTGHQAGAPLIVWFGSATTVTHNAGSVPANTKPIFAGNALTNIFPAGALLVLVLDGDHWHQPRGAQLDSSGILYGTGSNLSLTLNAAAGAFLGNGASQTVGYHIDASTIAHIRGTTVPVRFDCRRRYMQESVASASVLTFAGAVSSHLITGTTTVDYFTQAGWEEGCEITLEFDGILTITNNGGSPGGGQGRWLSKDGANITTAAGMVLHFRYDGANFKEIGR